VPGSSPHRHPSHLLIGELALRYDQYGDATAQTAMLERPVPPVQATPGVRAVSPVVAVPFPGTHGWDGRLAAEGQTPEEVAGNPMLNMEIVAPSYFTTLGVQLLRGRGLTDADREGAPAVVMLSERAARHYWPGQDPIGKRLMMGAKQDRPSIVVGIVPETRYRELREARPSIYFPLHQSGFPFAPTTLAIRTRGPPAELVPARSSTRIDPMIALREE
jgi:hypothetical protein